MDYGKKDPSLGWRFTDAWLSMAGNGDKGLPNGRPVDEWGIRLEGCRPVGSSVSAAATPTARRPSTAIEKYLEWLHKYAPPEAARHGPSRRRARCRRRAISPSRSSGTRAFTAEMAKPGLPVVNKDGTPKWRMAPSPHGAYWKDGMKLGYQDVGCWTLLKYLRSSE